MLGPKALWNLCVWFNRDLEDSIPTDQDWIDFAISHLKDNEKAEAITFLEDRLSAGLSDEEFEELWFSAYGMMGFQPIKCYRFMFEELLKRMKGEPASFKFR